jgi:hypothetical protein
MKKYPVEKIYDETYTFYRSQLKNKNNNTSKMLLIGPITMVLPT